MRRRVLVADDHPIFRSGVRQVLERAKRYEVVAEVGDGRAALEVLRAAPVDVAVVDIQMPEVDGLELVTQTAGWPEPPRIVLLTMYERFAEEAFRRGARGYLLKENAVDELIACIETVMRGACYVGEGILLEVDRAGTGRRRDPLAVLTPSERRVAKLVGELKSSKEIAELLCVSKRTVQNHRANACAKLGLEGRQALLRFMLALQRKT